LVASSRGTSEGLRLRKVRIAPSDVVRPLLGPTSLLTRFRQTDRVIAEAPDLLSGLTNLLSRLYQPVMRSSGGRSWPRNGPDKSGDALRIVIACITLWLPIFHTSLHDAEGACAPGRSLVSVHTAQETVHNHASECPICALHTQGAVQLFRPAIDCRPVRPVEYLSFVDCFIPSKHARNTSGPRAPPSGLSATL
jgi:hypothetical protein